MPKLAETISVTREGGAWSLKIDGQDFPWYVAPGVFITPIAMDESPGVQVTILADRVEALDTMNTAKSVAS